VRLLRTIVTAGVTAVIVLMVPAAAAQAAPSDAASCQPSPVSQPFLAWGDSTYYELVPGGDFAGPPDWSLDGGAALSDAGGTASLALADGAVATSPQACVNVVHPKVRFFARTDTPGTTVGVDAVFDDDHGSVSIPIGTVSPTTDWAPTQPLTFRPAIVPAIDGGSAYVGLSFTANGGTAYISDVYIDPWRKW